MSLRRQCILVLLNEIMKDVNDIQLADGVAEFNYLLTGFFVLSISERGVLKSPELLLDLFNYLFNSTIF